MTKLVWGDRKYEFGVDRCVFYPYPSYEPGVVWNGVTGIQESVIGGDAESYHFDGTKYLDFVKPKNYQAEISAFSAPNQFASAAGDLSVVPGMILTRQSRERFGLSYRTMVGDERGYKIHIVYNALASPVGKGYSTEEDSPSVEPFSYRIDAVPPIGRGYHPSAHFILDSSKVDSGALQALEDIIYGTDDSYARLPGIDELLDLTVLWKPLIIVEKPFTGLCELVPGSGDLYRSKMEGFLYALPQTRLQKTPVEGIYRME